MRILLIGCIAILITIIEAASLKWIAANTTAIYYVLYISIAIGGNVHHIYRLSNWIEKKWK